LTNIDLQERNLQSANSFLKKYIFDFSGRLIEEKISTDEKITFDFSNYSSGIYFYKLRNSEKIIGAGKIIKE
jgi:Secretion system C-terminal sorting domain